MMKYKSKFYLQNIINLKFDQKYLRFGQKVINIDLQHFYLIMMMRSAKRSSESMTGQVQPVTFRQLESRVNIIRSRNKFPPSRYNIDQQPLNRTQTLIPNRQFMQDVETDQLSTNFNPRQPEVMVTRTAVKSIARPNKQISRKSIQFTSLQPQKKRPLTSYKRGFKIAKSNLTNIGNELKGQAHAVIFKQQMEQFKNLYEHLAAILGSIKSGDLNVVEQAISEYVTFIQSKKISFIDDFIQGRQRKLQKSIRDSRLHESLSVAYLFLELAQSRIENHQSYLTNFIGYCLSNVLLTARVYIMKEGKTQFEESQFQSAMQTVQIGSFGQLLNNLDDVLLRLQHNNQIITMMHKKLGRFNPKFQTCIQLFFKNAQRKKTSCAQCTYYIFEYLSLHIHELQLTGISKSLQTAPVPYCPPPIKNYTLIIEPLGILLYDNHTRPYLFQFLQWAYKYFDIILWTWQMPYEPQIQKIYNKLDQYLISKLYRYHCIEENQIWVKDLSRLGRNTEKIIIVDYDKRIYNRQPKNGIELRWRYNATIKDKGLLYLCQILQQMVTSESTVEDTVTIYAEQLFNIRGY